MNEDTVATVPPWVAHPGIAPSAVSWRSGESESAIDAWARSFVDIEPNQRHRYLDTHEAPAIWRRWLDGYFSGRWDNPPAIFFRPEAPMRRLVTPETPVPDRLEALVLLVQTGGDLASWSVDPAATLAAEWQSTPSPWGMLALLRVVGHHDTEAAEHALAKVELGFAIPLVTAQVLRARVKSPPRWGDILQLVTAPRAGS